MKGRMYGMVVGKVPKKRRGRPKKQDSPAVRKGRERKVYDVWYTPTVRDVYAQLKVAEQMLSRIPDIELATVKREMGLLEDMMWQFIN